MKNLVAVLWILVVIFFYFANHNYYTTGWDEILAWTPYLLLIPGICFLCKNFTKKITTTKIIAGVILLILITGNFIFLIKDPSIYHGPDLFYRDGQVIAIENESQITGQELIVIKNEGSLINTREALRERIPSEYHEFIEHPGFLDIQIGLITKTLAILGILLLFTLTSGGFGFTVLKKALGRKTELSTDNGLISIGIGLLTIAMGSFILGTFNLLNITAIWVLFGILLVLSWKSIIQITKKLLAFEYKNEGKLLNFNLLIMLAIIITASINFIDNISPIPRGWDGLNQYMNIAQRLYETEGLIQIGGNYFWELIMSLGLIMFHWNTATMVLASLFPAILCLIGLYFILRKFISKKGALIGSAAIYLTPLFTFHGAEENKIDLGLFTMSIIAFLSLYLSTTTENKKEKWTYLIISGLLCGFCFGIKLTALMIILGFIAVLLSKTYKTKGLLAGIFGGAGALLLGNQIGFGANTEISIATYNLIGYILLVLSAGLIGMSIFKTKNLKPIKYILTLTFCALLTFSPWLIKNYAESHSLSKTGLLFGEHPGPTIDEELLLNEYNLDTKTCGEGTGTYEELDRYLGYDQFPINLMVLPWRVTMNDSLGYTDFGWLFLAFIPGLAIFLPNKDKKIKAITAFGISYWIFWAISSNGVIWYGLPGFLALGVWIGYLIDNYEKKEETGKHFINIIVLIFLISSLVYRLGTAGSGVSLLYASGLMDSETATRDTFPGALEIHDFFSENKDEENNLIWKIGTNLNYFIEDNFTRTFNDQYLDDINCLYTEKDPELLTERLKALGFGYIVFDYNSYTLSPDPQGTLKEKYDTVLDYLLGNTEILYLDHYYFKHIVVKIP